MMPSIKAIAIAFVASIGLTTAASLGMKEAGTASGCTGGSGCCIPSCLVTVSDSLGGGDGSVSWSGNCKWNYENPKGTQDVGDGHQMTWLRDPDGNPVIDVYRKSDKKYDRWAVSNCQDPDSTGGSQCAPQGGGCDTKQILFGAQGQF